MYGVEAGGPEEEGCVGVFFESEAFLKIRFVGLFGGGMGVGGVCFDQVGIGGGIEGGVGCVENAGGTAGIKFGGDFGLNVGGDKVVLTVDDFSEEGGADGVDEVGGKESAAEVVDWVLVAAFFVVIGWGFEE